MESIINLIIKIRRIIKGLDLETPLINVYSDEQKNILIRVTSPSFKDWEDKEAQDKLWNALRSGLPTDEFKKIISLVHESPIEINTRLSIDPTNNEKFNNIWFHQTPEQKKYWLFIDIAKFDNEYKTFFTIVNAKDNFQKGSIFNYPNEVIEFMELQQEEIVGELFNSTFNNAEAEIKMHLMFKSDELDDKGLRGRDNYFSYVYDSFSLKKASKSDLLFTTEEIDMIEKSIKYVGEFKLKSDILKAIEVSKILNSSIGHI